MLIQDRPHKFPKYGHLGNLDVYSSSALYLVLESVPRNRCGCFEEMDCIKYARYIKA